MKRIFWATCPQCDGEFIVDWELRHLGRNLICPHCQKHFLPDEAAKLDERF